MQYILTGKGPMRILEIHAEAKKVYPEIKYPAVERTLARSEGKEFTRLGKSYTIAPGFEIGSGGLGMPGESPGSVQLPDTVLWSATGRKDPAPTLVSPSMAGLVEDWLNGLSTRYLATKTEHRHNKFNDDLDTLASLVKTPRELALELKPDWSPGCAMDATPIDVMVKHDRNDPRYQRYKGNYHYESGFVIAIREGNGDWPNYKVIKSEENRNEVKQFCEETWEFYKPDYVNIDGNEVFESVIRETHPSAVISPDPVHIMRNVGKAAPFYWNYKIPPPDLEAREEFYRRANNVIYASTNRACDDRLAELIRLAVLNEDFHTDWAAKALCVLARQLDTLKEGIRAREKYADANVVSGTNTAELLFSLVKPKFRQMKGIHNSEYAPALVNLIFGYRRLKPFSASDNLWLHHNGRSPLQLAGTHIPENRHWLDILLRKPFGSTPPIKASGVGPAAEPTQTLQTQQTQH